MRAPPDPRKRRARRQRAGVGLVVLAAHALIAIALSKVVVVSREVPGAPRVSVRLLPIETQPMQPTRPAQAVSARAEPAVPRREARAPRRPVEPAAAAIGAQAAPVASPRLADPAVATLAPPASAPASGALPAAPPSGNLLETSASRHALSRAARDPNLASRVDAQVGVHSPTAAQQLPSAVQQAGKGDCLKGDYPYSGMGLLSAPFLVAALASGNCAK